MHATSISPLSVTTLIWRPRSDAFALTVVCKGGFHLRPGESRLIEAQTPAQRADLYWEDDSRRSLRTPSDLVPFKRHAEVFVGGHAYAPNEQPVKSLVARVAVGEWSKAVEVHGERYWAADGRLSAAAPFVKMPLRWERAGGGPGTWNPVGMAPNGPVDAHGLRRVPNVVPLGSSLRSAGQEIAPAGLGPLAPTWPERMAKLRRHASVWRHDGWMTEPLPDDVDASYFNAAPPDQQMAQIPLGERIVLDHLHPEHPQLVTVLEKVTPHAMVQRGPGEVQEVRLRCDTMWIDTDSGTCSVVWRGVVPLQHPGEQGTIVVTAERVGEDEDAAAGTIVVPMKAKGGRKNPTMPFSIPEAGVSIAAPQVTVREVEPIAENEGTGTIVGGLVVASPLPFPVQQEIELEAEEDAEEIGDEELDEGTMTMVAPIETSGRGKPATPFMALPPGAASALQLEKPEPKPERRAYFGTGTMPQWVDGAPVPTAALPFVKEAAAPVAPAQVEAPVVPVGVMGSEAPAVPEMLGPIPVAGSATAAEAAPVAEAVAEAAAGAAADASAEKKLPIEEYPIERCAGIAARMARGKADRYAILEAEKLKEEQWSALHAHWQGEIKAEAGRGEKKLMLAYDQGYVAALEKECGVIGAKEYARLVVAAERGKEAEVLAEMGLPRGAMMRIRRVWLERMVRDKRVGREVREELCS